MKFPSWEREKWVDLEENPLIIPIKDRKVIADPQVLLPGEFDDKWHIFFTGGDFYHYVSMDGIKWEYVYDYKWDSWPAYITSDGKLWIVYYTHISLETGVGTIKARTSKDLINWSEPIDILEPELDWEKEGKKKQVRNPCLIKLPNGKYRLYYSGGTVWMHDMGFEEPKYIGVAESDSPFGPFKKRSEPIIRPDEKIWYRNYGAGAIKVYKFGDFFLALTNGIYIDNEGKSRSAINLMLSKDGTEWIDASYNPIILPSKGWKKALVYQLDLRYWENKLWLFYNARDGWKNARECIGCSILEWESLPVPEKLWELPK